MKKSSPQSLVISSVTSLFRKVKRSTINRAIVSACLLLAVGLSLEIQERQVQGRELWLWKANATAPLVQQGQPPVATEASLGGVPRSRLFRQMEHHMKEVHGLSVQVRQAPSGWKENRVSGLTEKQQAVVINVANPVPTMQSVPTGHPGMDPGQIDDMGHLLQSVTQRMDKVDSADQKMGVSTLSL